MRRNGTVDEPASPEALRSLLCTLRQERRDRKLNNPNRHVPRTALTRSERAAVLAKTGKRCHICGGEINGSWQADHVLAHSGGGQHRADNYLPAHKLCNNYRWDYLEEEFQNILKLGVWARTQIENGTAIGNNIAKRFVSYERQRIARHRHAHRDRRSRPKAGC
jgi:hypothetical protein